MKWISVKDRLPEIIDNIDNNESKQVLVMDSDEDFFVAILCYDPMICKVPLWVDTLKQRNLRDITHWAEIELPENE